MIFTENAVLNTMEDVKLTNLGTFFMISITDLKLIIELSKYMLVFFSLIN